MASAVVMINVSDVVSLTNFTQLERNLFYKASGIPGKKDSSPKILILKP
jgi:hypothetical protein